MDLSLAEDINKGEIIHGTILFSLDNEYIINTDFVCPSNKCRRKATPCAYNHMKKPSYKKSSYFRYIDGHTAECDLHNPDNVQPGDPKNPTTIVESGLYISKLNLTPPPGQQVRPEEPNETGHVVRGNRPTNTAPPGNTQNNQKSTSSIKPIVDLYIKDYQTYSELPLEITGLGERSYKDTFQLIFHKENIQFIRKSIFYGAINTEREMTENNGVYTVNLVAKPYKLLIDTSDWIETHKNVFLKEFKENFKAASLYYKKHRSKPQKQMFIFFLGDIDNDKQEFKADSFKLIYFTFTDKFYLPKSKGNWQYGNIIEFVSDSNVIDIDNNEVTVEPIPEISLEVKDKEETTELVKVENLDESNLKIEEIIQDHEQPKIISTPSKPESDVELKEENIVPKQPITQSLISKIFNFLIKK